MHFNVSKKNILITGGTSGIGLMLAQRFSEAGAHVIIVGRRASGQYIADKLNIYFLSADVTNETAMADLFASAEAKIGKLDVLILNAGDGSLGEPLSNTNEDTFDHVFSANVKSTFFGLKHGPAHMQDGGAIICTSSAATAYRLPMFEPYVSSKASINSLVKSAALELGDRAICVNAVCPSGVATEMAPYDAVLDVKIGKLSALGKAFMTETQIVGIYHFLSSEEGSFITGQSIYVDGGLGIGCTAAVMTSIMES